MKKRFKTGDKVVFVNPQFVRWNNSAFDIGNVFVIQYEGTSNDGRIVFYGVGQTYVVWDNEVEHEFVTKSPLWGALR